MSGFKSLSPEATAKLARFADGMVVAIAACLPWSTSATAICTVVWLVAVIPTIDPDRFLRRMAHPAAWLPAALFALAAFGLLWANVPFSERVDGLDGFLKLLAIPLLLAQFSRSDRGMNVLIAFLISCTLLLLASGLTALSPHGNGWGFGKSYGVPVKDYISQSAMFTTCAFALLYLAFSELQLRRYPAALLFAVLAALFLCDMFFIVSSRTALITIPVLLVLLTFRLRSWRNIGGAGLAVAVLIGVTLVSSDKVRTRLGDLADELHAYQSAKVRTSAGERYDFWKRSFSMMEAAPILGSGTGSIREAFARSAAGQQGVSGFVTDNPHNQTLAVGIQLGAIGILVLYAMWCVHFLSFMGPGLVAWAGTIIVTQNVVGSLFNSHLFDSTHGWLYVLGVGVTGGMMLKEAEMQRVTRDKAASAPS